MKRLGISVAAAVLLSSCATPLQPPADWSTVDAGPEPSPEFIAQLESRVRAGLKDPEGARIVFGTPTKAKNRSAGDFYAYRICALVNGKNSFGAYVGYVPYYFLVRDDKVMYETWRGHPNEAMQNSLGNVSKAAVWCEGALPQIPGI